MTRKKLIKKIRYAFLQLGMASFDTRNIAYCRDLPNKELTNEDRWKLIEKVMLDTLGK